MLEGVSDAVLQLLIIAINSIPNGNITIREHSIMQVPGRIKGFFRDPGSKDNQVDVSFGTLIIVTVRVIAVQQRVVVC